MPTKIEWTDETWPVVTGCTHAGTPGCDHCYGARMAATRLRDHPRYKGLATFHNGKAKWTGKVNLNYDVLEQPLRWRRPRMIFVASMGDLFHEDVSDDFIIDVFVRMGEAPQHIFQVLTKRPDRMCDFILKSTWGTSPLHNLWLGTSIENQAAADERREYLEQCPAAVKFVSYEPALGLVDWTGWEFVSQIISGGESGPGARPSHPDWHRATRDFCQENGIAYFMKQWGGWVPNEHGCGGDYHFNSKHVCLNLAGERFDGWMEAHGERIAIIAKTSKKRAGRLLDGRIWQQFPVSTKTIA